MTITLHGIDDNYRSPRPKQLAGMCRGCGNYHFLAFEAPEIPPEIFTRDDMTFADRINGHEPVIVCQICGWTSEGEPQQRACG